MNEQQIRQLIQQELAAYAANNAYNYNQANIHTHSGTDSVKIPLSSVLEAIVLTGTKGGVINTAQLGYQKLNNNLNLNSGNTQGVPLKVNILPINVIYGSGVGTNSEFNGGSAAPGTMVFFDNYDPAAPGLSNLWIKTLNSWYGIAATAVR